MAKIMDANPDHYKVGDADFIAYQHDPQISRYGDWMFANGYNLALSAVVRCRDCRREDVCCIRRTADPDWFCADAERK